MLRSKSQRNKENGERRERRTGEKIAATSIKRIIFSYPHDDYHQNQLKMTVLIVMKGSNSKERGSRNNSKNKKHRESSDEDSEVGMMMMMVMMMMIMMIMMMT